MVTLTQDDTHSMQELHPLTTQWTIHQDENSTLTALGINQMQTMMLAMTNVEMLHHSEFVFSEIKMVSPNELIFRGLYLNSLQRFQFEAQLIIDQEWAVMRLYNIDQFNQRHLMFIQEAPLL